MKNYRRHNSFSDDEIDRIRQLRHLQTKEIVDLFPGRNLSSISYLRRKAGALRIFSHGGTTRRTLWQRHKS